MTYFTSIKPIARTAISNAYTKGDTATAFPSDIMSAISDAGVPHHFNKGDVIPKIFFGTEFVFTISHGCIALYKNKTADSKKITHLAFDDSIIGFTLGDFESFNGVALNPSDIIVFPADIYTQALLTDSSFSNYVIQHLVAELKESQIHNYCIGRLNAVESVAALITHLRRKQRKAVESEQDADDLPLPLNRYEVADYLGLTIETVSRSFSDLKNRKIISFTDSKSVRIEDWGALERVFQA